MMPSLRLLLAHLGEQGLRLSLREDGLAVFYPGSLPRTVLAPLRNDLDNIKTIVVGMDADLAAARAALDALSKRPGTTPALLRVIQMRREVYASYRDRLADYDLTADALAFVARCIDPLELDHHCLTLVARSCEPSKVPFKLYPPHYRRGGDVPVQSTSGDQP